MREAFDGTDRFEVVSRLGSGGMGVVYKVFDRETESYAALKVLRVSSADSLLRFKNEFRALQGVRHPNLIRLGELTEAEGAWFYTMELVDGDDLISYIRANPDRLRPAIAQLARGLDALHGAGLIHRDIKPLNVRVARDGRVVVLDFGLVLAEDDVGELSESKVVGTGAYIAPEQITPRNASPASDCYAVGVVLYEALTGGVPFRGNAMEVLVRKQREQPVPPGDVADDVPEDLAQLCLELLATEPGGRPTAADILARIGEREEDRGDGERRRRDTGEPPLAPLFVGRVAELDRLLAAAHRPRAARVLVVRGPSGVGKSALVRQLGRLVRERDPDAVVLAGQCYERETVPFKGVDGVVDRLTHYLRRLSKIDAAALLPRQAGLLAQVFPVLRRVDVIGESPRPRGDQGDPLQQRKRAFAALRELLLRAALRWPLVIVIDDLQWADADSLALLAEIMQPPDAPPLVLVVTLRPPPATAPDPVAALAVPVELIELGGLPHADAEQLARDWLERLGDADPSRARDLAAEAGGHPMFIYELAQHVAAGGREARVARLDEALRDRFDGLGLAAREVIDLVAVAGAPIAQDTASVAAELDLADYTAAVEELRAAQLVHARGSRRSDAIECYHDRIRDAVLAAMDDARRRDLHHRLADALEATGRAESEPEVVLYHLEAAGQHARAAYHAELAAERAVKALAFDRAAALYRVALRVGNYGADEARRLQFEQARALVNAGRGAQAANLYLQAAIGADDGFALECRRRAAEQLLRSGHVERGMEVTQLVLDALGESLPATPRRALWSLGWQRARLRVRGLGWKLRDASDIAPRDLLRLDVFRSVAEGLGLVDNIRGADFQCRHLRLALELGEPAMMTRALALEAVFQAGQGNGRRARDVAARVAELAEAQDDAGLRGWAVMARAAPHYFCDNAWAATVEDLDEAELLFGRQLHSAGWETDTVRAYRAFCLLYQGRLAELASLVTGYVREAEKRGDLFSVVNFRTRLGITRLAEGDAGAAERELEDAMRAWLPPTRSFNVQHFFALHSQCELALYVGDGRRAGAAMASRMPALKESQLLRAPMVAAEIGYLRGRIALAQASAPVGARADRKTLLAEARRHARALLRLQPPVARHTGALLDASCARAAGDGDVAVERLRAAVAELDAAGTGLYAHVGRRRLGEWTGQKELVDRAASWADDQDIRDWDALAQMLLPDVG